MFFVLNRASKSLLSVHLSLSFFISLQVWNAVSVTPFSLLKVFSLGRI